MDAHIFSRRGICGRLTQKEGREFLEREWNAQYWSRTTTMTEEEFYEDEDNKKRGLEHGWEVVNEDRGISKKAVVEEDEDEDDDDEDDEDDDEEGMVAEGEDEEDGDEEDDEDSSEADATGGGTDKLKSKKVASKTEADVAKVTDHFREVQGFSDCDSLGAAVWCPEMFLCVTRMTLGWVNLSIFF